MNSIRLDGHKLLFHLDSVEKWLRAEPFFPLYLSLSLTNRCNHQCRFCAYGNEHGAPAFFPAEKLPPLLKEWKEGGLKAVFLSGDGEPLLNQDAACIAEAVADSGIRVALNTNGSLLKPKTAERLARCLSWIRVSINAGTPETYARIHGTTARHFNLVLENLAGLVAARNRSTSSGKTPMTIGVQSLLLRENEGEILSLARQVKDLGVDYFALKPYLRHPSNPYDGGITEAAALSESLESLQDERFVCRVRNTFRIQPRTYIKCYGHRFIAELDARGDLYACGPWLGDKRHYFGNVHESSFSAVWFSEQRKQVCRMLETTPDLEKCMPACRCDAVNRYLWDLRNPPAHVNFI